MDLVAAWRAELHEHGVWANDPVPLFPYPSAPEYRRLFGEPDDQAWERALDHYLSQFESFSDIQEDKPLRLLELEAS
jgi:anaerobic magnesium-protoporphyrin IX monomethyl ester cyclase